MPALHATPDRTEAAPVGTRRGAGEQDRSGHDLLVGRWDVRADRRGRMRPQLRWTLVQQDDLPSQRLATAYS